MENVVSFENIRIADNFKKLLDDKKNHEERTLTEMRTSVRRKAKDIKKLEDISSLLKDISPIRFTYPEIYEQEKQLLIPIICESVNIKDSPKVRVDLNSEMTKLESVIAQEVAPLLGVDETVLNDVETYVKRFGADYANQVIIDVEKEVFTMRMDSFKMAFPTPTIPVGKKDMGIGEYVIKFALLKHITGHTIDSRYPRLITNPDTLKTTYTINQWKGFREELTTSRLDKPEDKCKFILNHLYHMVCNGIKEHYDLIMDYFAHMIQKPWEKPGWAILLVGKEGCGKDIVAKYISKMLHPSHYIKIGDAEFKDPLHTGWRKGKLLADITEFNGLTEKNMGHAYTVIESDEARILEKFAIAYTMKDICRFIITTNRYNAIQANTDTRRFFVPEFNNKMAANSAGSLEFQMQRTNYFSNLAEEMGGEDQDNVGLGVVALYQILCDRDISKFNVKNPNLHTKPMEDMIETSETSLDILIDDIISRGEIPDYSELPNIAFLIRLSETKETEIHTNDVRRNYSTLYDKMKKEGGRADPPPLKLPMQLIKGLGLPWDGPRNNKTHYKILSKNNANNYIFPPLKVIREAYYAKHPDKRPPA